jgi:inosine/xanthosine triphosphate pyrophosphatase family protein
MQAACTIINCEAIAKTQAQTEATLADTANADGFNPYTDDTGEAIDVLVPDPGAYTATVKAEGRTLRFTFTVVMASSP